MIWSWRPPELDGVEKGVITPATGPSGTFTAKARKPTPDKANDELGAQVDVEEPGTPATIHAVDPPLRVGVLEPEYKIEEKVVPGAKGGGAGPGALKPSDVLEFHVTFDHVDKPKELGDAGHFRWHLSQDGAFLSELGGIKIPDDKPFEARAHRWDGDTLVYSVYCHHAGAGKYKMDFNVPGTKAHTKEVALKSESSLGFFLARCGAATERHRAIVATFDAYLQQGFMNYKSGYEAAEAAFKEYAERQKLTKEILLGILFAGLGGAAGGAAGGLVKFSATQKAFAGKLTKVQEMGLGALTDAPKDIAKYTVRLGRKLGEGGGNGGPTPDDATPDAHGGGGKSGVAGSEDPLNWHALAQKAKSLEEAKIAATLEQWKTTTIDAITRGSDATIDFDPINEITAITKLDGKGIGDLGEPPSAAEYEKNMWEAWIEKYAYTLQERVGCGQMGYRVEDNVGKELEAEMERVAKVLAEKGIESSWLNEALTEARRRADEKAAGR